MLDMHHELQRIPQFQQFLLQLVINLKLFEAVSAGDPPQTWLFPGNYVGSEVWVTLASHCCHPHAGPDPIHLSPTGLSHQIINVLMSKLFILSLLDIFSESWKIQRVYLVLLQKQITILTYNWLCPNVDLVLRNHLEGKLWNLLSFRYTNVMSCPFKCSDCFKQTFKCPQPGQCHWIKHLNI